MHFAEEKYEGRRIIPTLMTRVSIKETAINEFREAVEEGRLFTLFNDKVTQSDHEPGACQCQLLDKVIRFFESKGIQWDGVTYGCE